MSLTANGSYSGPGDRLAFLLTVVVHMENGDDIIIPVKSAGYDWENDIFRINCDAALPIDTNSIKSITVNEETFTFK